MSKTFFSTLLEQIQNLLQYIFEGILTRTVKYLGYKSALL